jgi:predicted dinucleotide-binding enzyme
MDIAMIGAGNVGSALAESIGFRALDVGPLSVARVLEGMALINISLNMRNGWSWQTEWKLAGPTG